jgi:quercetin dioxygenase-like cupin family protein
MSDKTFRRIVTGHNEAGLAIIVEDAPPTRVQRFGGEGGPMFYEVWHTKEMPARIDRASLEPDEQGIVLAPPKNGTRIRVLDFPPVDETRRELSAEEAREHFATIGAGDALASQSDGKRQAKHAYMHRTETVDYGIVLEGELVLIMDEGETTIRAGDIVIQRGTNHGWENRSNVNCRIAFILVDGKFDAELA